MAGRGNIELIGKTPSCTFPREGIARAAAFFLILLLTSLLPSCKPDNIQTGTDLKYFDVKGFFAGDTARLRKLNHITHKTVYHNGNNETKDVRINNWGLELSLFSQSDINKPAWRDSYTIVKTDNIEIYRAKDPDLKTREIIVKRKGNMVKWIIINNSTKNILYQTKERLSYFPDSIYIIQKDQQICLFGDNRYTRKIALLSLNQYAVKGSLN
ncbi:MAG: hypothetical protein H7289_06520 [Mucilaginibacter sp.]|nr:hypothetical protein [Mucilaginibacter sp.]